MSSALLPTSAQASRAKKPLNCRCMLEPEGRQLLLDALRPPAGYELDHAVGTTYSLDLMSLLAAPLGFALFDRESSDGRLVADPISLIEAVRRSAERIDIFCQAGQIAIPREHRVILTYLESSIHQVAPPNREAIFHPKVWVIRYRSTVDQTPTYRLLCLSRNLTFDRSWDTVLCLDGSVKPGGSGDPRLPEFIRRLTNLARVEASPPSVQRRSTSSPTISARWSSRRRRASTGSHSGRLDLTLFMAVQRQNRSTARGLAISYGGLPRAVSTKRDKPHACVASRSV